MYNLNALIIYNSSDVTKNKWFINHLIECLSLNNITSTFITTSEFYNNTGLIDIIPDFIINRSRDYNISIYYEKKGIRSFNSSEIIHIANDKDLTYQSLLNNNIPFLPYITVPSEYFSEKSNDILLNIAKDFGYPFVMKPAEGHGGDHVCLIRNDIELEKELELIKIELESGKLNYKKILLQKPSNILGKDLRVYVLNNTIYSSILRTSNNDFRANFSLGGNTCEYYLTDSERNLVNKVITALPSDLCGIDFVFNNNEIILNEIEDAVGTRMLYANTSHDIIDDYVKYIVTEIKKP